MGNDGFQGLGAIRHWPHSGQTTTALSDQSEISTGVLHALQVWPSHGSPAAAGGDEDSGVVSASHTSGSISAIAGLACGTAGEETTAGAGSGRGFPGLVSAPQ